MKSLFSPDWQNSLKTGTNYSATFCDWIADRSSLTEKVKGLCHGKFRVVVLCHEMIAAPDFSSGALKIDSGAELLHREVLLCDDKTPLVFACSLLPGNALVGRFSEIRELGARPLGHWIFSEPVLHRDSMKFANISADAALFDSLRIQTDISGEIPGRKTVFSGAEYPFIVSEFFLPELQGRI